MASLDLEASVAAAVAAVALLVPAVAVAVVAQRVAQHLVLVVAVVVVAVVDVFDVFVDGVRVVVMLDVQRHVDDDVLVAVTAGEADRRENAHQKHRDQLQEKKRVQFI